MQRLLSLIIATLNEGLVAQSTNHLSNLEPQNSRGIARKFRRAQSLWPHSLFDHDPWLTITVSIKEGNSCKLLNDFSTEKPIRIRNIKRFTCSIYWIWQPWWFPGNQETTKLCLLNELATVHRKLHVIYGTSKTLLLYYGESIADPARDVV